MTEMTQTRQILVALGAVVLAFLVGFLWQYVRADRAESRLESVSQQLEFQRLESTLAAATIEAQRGSFEVARQHSSEFFTSLQRAIPDAPAGERGELEAILARRDILITYLSREDPQGVDLLERSYFGYRSAMGGAAVGVPAPGTRPPADSPADSPAWDAVPADTQP